MDGAFLHRPRTGARLQGDATKSKQISIYRRLVSVRSLKPMERTLRVKPARNGAPAAAPARLAFEVSRERDFFSTTELTTQTGHKPADWPLVVLKELVDNALDACEEASIAPEVQVIVGDGGITVVDNGPGIPAHV